MIERRISAGSFGLVYKASDLSIENHAIALKMLRKRAASEAERRAALRELQLLASVSHPSVVQFKDYGWFDGRLWFTMPWYDGITLQERLGHRPLTRRQARPIFERLAFGLAAMHGVGIHHHDIKPDNIFLAKVAGFEEGLPVLLDLGVAAKTGEAPSGFTAEYVAPETASAALGVDRHPIGSAADVFALALTLRNALEPETAPASGGSPLPMLNQRANRPIDPPSRRELRYLAPAFRRWLSLDPADRPTAAEFARELAVLTLPEERSESRRRMLLRTSPLLALLGAAVAALSYRVDQQNAQIDEQREQLTERQRETERLREESDQNLGQIEAQLERMGKKDAQLRKAVAIARALDERLGAAERVRVTLSRSVQALKDGQAQLLAENQVLTEERDDLRHKQQVLQEAQRELSGELAALQDDHGQLSEALRAVTAARAETEAERNRLQERTLIAEQELQQLRGRTSRVEADRRELMRERDSLREQVTNLTRERERLLRREQVLRAKLAEQQPPGGVASGGRKAGGAPPVADGTGSVSGRSTNVGGGASAPAPTDSEPKRSGEVEGASASEPGGALPPASAPGAAEQVRGPPTGTPHSAA